MYNLNKHILVFLILSLWLSSCGDLRVSTNDSTGSVRTIVTNSKSFNPNISHGVIEQYKVTITAEDIETPIVAFFEGTAISGTVENIPVGGRRVVKVEAFNPNNKMIRAGETEEVDVIGGETAEVEVDMESVPVFANLNDGNIVPNTRFIARVFSDPKDAVTIDDEFEGMGQLLMDVNSNADELTPDAATCEARFAPALLSSGEHKLTAKNVRTGRSSAVTVRLIDGTKIRPALFYNGGVAATAKIGGPLTQVVTTP